MLEISTPRAAFFVGRPAVDAIRPARELLDQEGIPPHAPGDKAVWVGPEEAAFEALMSRGEGIFPGGGALNAAAYCAAETRVGRSELTPYLASVLGEDDAASNLIRTFMERAGIVDLGVRVRGHKPTRSIIEKESELADRMARVSRCSKPLHDYLMVDDEDRRDIASTAELVGLFSMKSLHNLRVQLRLVQRAQAEGRQRTVVHVPAGEELEEPSLLKAVLIANRVKGFMLAGNKKELSRGFGMSPETDSQELARHISLYVGRVLLTNGPDRVYWGERGDVMVFPVEPVGDKYKNQIGAGDRVAIATALALHQGHEPEVAVPMGIRSAASVIRHDGAVEDLEPVFARAA